MKDILNQVAFGNRDPEVASSLAGRLARLDKRLTKDDRALLAGLAGGADIGTITRNLVDALDPDQSGAALNEALAPIAANPELRIAILDVRKSYEQTIDETSRRHGAVRRLQSRGPREGVGPCREVPRVH